MAKQYKFNRDTLSYTEVHHGVKFYFWHGISYVLFAIVAGVGFVFLYETLFDSPKEKALKHENQHLLAQYELLNKKLDQVESVLSDVCSRDENIYRVIYEADSIPASVRKAGFGGINRYQSLEDMENAELVVSTTKRLDIIQQQLYVQSRSFDEIISLVERNSEMIDCMPAIMPLKNKDLTRTASGWGYRIHPIYKIKKFHTGMDFAAPSGTEIYATGDGVVTQVQTSYSGYGKHIKIDHGFGYQTIYGHMSSFNVKVGQHVKRGDVIGYVGSTGTSTAPHLHYEVVHKGKKVNPQFYYFQEDLSTDEFERMIEISNNSNKTFD